MEKEDYIALQNLLTKLRVSALEEIGNTELDAKYRDKNMKIIRYVDWLRNNIRVNLNNKEL